ncbi:YHS domain-containing protein [Vibrio sp. D404a]|uniref:YHS domain-containing (seleno)protein n=1 Tax=unclassified Vibrio TaxID=2614977 RepID=UPI002553691E|nr:MULTISPECIES: YHS domain-containing (seleno)protein [unclassified Vibrio]MDK9736062.1 YHS domain-containing protein [Vibrio sp. D404a]MDK9797772.1 YHS domain-containing protein [Vibrio sp. D449a]
MKYLVKIVLTLVFWLGVAAPSFALEPVYSDFFGKAIRGYDPVAYFTQSKAVKGNDDYSYEWNGAEWRFSSQQHLDLFKADPEQYAPQYGGYCAWAVSKGYTAKIDPQAWNIVDGKLYLNYSKSVQQTWQGDIAGNIANADANWPRLLNE